LNKKIHYFVDTTERGDRSLRRHPKEGIEGEERVTLPTTLISPEKDLAYKGNFNTYFSNT
jgi:hypothetical protein